MKGIFDATCKLVGPIKNTFLATVVLTSFLIVLVGDRLTESEIPLRRFLGSVFFTVSLCLPVGGLSLFGYAKLYSQARRKAMAIQA